MNLLQKKRQVIECQPSATAVPTTAAVSAADIAEAQVRKINASGITPTATKVETTTSAATAVGSV